MKRGKHVRRVLRIGVLLALCLAAVGCSTGRPLVNRLYTLDDMKAIKTVGDSQKHSNRLYDELVKNHGRPVTEVEQAVDEALAGATADTPLLLYVHGRGNEPYKSAKSEIKREKSNIIQNLQQNYGVRVLQFHWQSQNTAGEPCVPSFLRGLISYPNKQASASAGNLILVLEELARLRKEPASVLANRNVHMLVHSMGGYALKEVGLQEGMFDAEGAVDNLVLTGADVSVRGSDAWLKRLSFAEDVVVLTHFLDPVLVGSSILSYDGRLGMWGWPKKRPSYRIKMADMPWCKLSHRHFGESIHRSEKGIRKQIGALFTK